MRPTRPVHLVARAAAVAALTLPLAATVAPAGADEVQEVREGACALFDGGEATVDAGVPISLVPAGFGTGRYGLVNIYLRKQTTTLTINGETVDISDTYPAPTQMVDDSGTWWLARPVNYDLGTLEAGETLTVTQVTTFSGPILIAYPPVGSSGWNGPFLLGAEGEGPLTCTITAV